VSRPTCGVPAIRLGVDDAFVTAVPGLPAPVTFGEIFPPDHFPIWFYRSPKGPDLEIRADELPIEAITSARQRRYL
jgi:5-dehydro-2-deoxygluconokinase